MLWVTCSHHVDRVARPGGQTKDAVAAEASKDEILEAVAVATVMGGTAVSTETWRVVKVLEEMGEW